ncbi:hypothetical protein [Isoptericola sp. QY 916]|uniref:hypothetical protein n=1 Tax=Isoptericola sp. QY 916 TaxID=2782570 RepID=UPI003D300155|nr:hypothetical protein [Isoptericola sp. QY 916]
MFHAVSTEGGVRVGAGVRRRLGAIGAMLTLALMSTGLAVPTAVADVEQDSTVVAPVHERWWRGQDITLEVSVTRDGAPGVGQVSWLAAGSGARAPLTDGRATIVISSADLRPGPLRVVAGHVDTSAGVDPETGQYPVRSTGSVVVEVVEPTSPVLSATEWYYGDAHALRFDLTGTDEPREGAVTVDLGGGVERSAPLVDGVAAFALDGTEVPGWRTLRFQHTTAAGDPVSSWGARVHATSKPVTVKATVPSSVRYGSDVVVPVRVTSTLGTPGGRVSVTRSSDGKSLASAAVVGGKATLRFPASRLAFGDSFLAVEFDGAPEYEERVDRWHALDVRPRATSVAVSTGRTWTYGKGRRIAVTVSSPGATPTGRVELWSYGKKLRTGTLAKGKASLYVPATRVEPHGGDRQSMVVKYVGPSTFERSQRSWSQKVAEARPKVTFRMDRRSFPADWSDRRSVRATVTVTTAGLPERGRLCLWTRDPQSRHSRWAGCWTNWSWKVDDGRRTIRVPGVLLAGSPGKSFIKVEYIPKDPNVRQVFSNTVTLRHTAP